MKKKFTPIEDLAKKWMKDPKFLAEYDALEEEFALAAALIEARGNANLTQKQVADRMQTSQAAIAKLEGNIGNPSVNTLRRFAVATGTRLRIEFDHVRSPTRRRGRRINSAS